MRAITLPFNAGYVTKTKLVLPTAWQEYLLDGNTSRLSPEDVQVLHGICQQFGICTDADGPSVTCDNHDAFAEYPVECPCRTFTFYDVAH